MHFVHDTSLQQPWFIQHDFIYSKVWTTNLWVNHTILDKFRWFYIINVFHFTNVLVGDNPMCPQPYIGSTYSLLSYKYENLPLPYSWGNFYGDFPGFIIKNYPNLLSNYYPRYTFWVIYPFYAFTITYIWIQFPLTLNDCTKRNGNVLIFWDPISDRNNNFWQELYGKYHTQLYERKL